MKIKLLDKNFEYRAMILYYQVEQVSKGSFIIHLYNKNIEKADFIKVKVENIRNFFNLYIDFRHFAKNIISDINSQLNLKISDYI